MRRRRAVCDAADRAHAAAANGQGLGAGLGRDDQLACVQARPHDGCRKDKKAVRSARRRAGRPEIGKVRRAASSECRWDEALRPPRRYLRLPGGRIDDDAGATAGGRRRTRGHSPRPPRSARRRSAERSRSDREPALDHRRAGRNHPWSRPRQSKGVQRRLPRGRRRHEQPVSERTDTVTRDARREGAGLKARERMTPAVAIHPQHAGRRALDEHEDVITAERAVRPRTARPLPRAMYGSPPSPDSPAAHERTGPPPPGRKRNRPPGKRARVVHRHAARRRRRCRERSPMVARWESAEPRNRPRPPRPRARARQAMPFRTSAA